MRLFGIAMPGGESTELMRWGTMSYFVKTVNKSWLLRVQDGAPDGGLGVSLRLG